MLLAADGVPNTEIADRTATSRPTVLKWRGRYVDSGIEGLDDDPRPGRAPVIDEVAVLAETLADKGKPPAHLGVTHWSARLMAARLGISFASVARIWRKWNIQPHRVETFKFSTDPELEAKLRDVVGLYIDPPAGAVVVSVDEKSQIQALDRTQPILPLRHRRVLEVHRKSPTPRTNAILRCSSWSPKPTLPESAASIPRSMRPPTRPIESASTWTSSLSLRTIRDQHLPSYNETRPNHSPCSTQNRRSATRQNQT